jgi:2-oxoacid:acceptor oxidoreductase delta subunit (pyruvate/2-ketoisovalerate family)
MRRRPLCPLPEPDSRAQRKPRTPKNAPPPPMTREEAIAEARRCLWLNECTGCEVCVLMCPDQAITKDPVTQKAVIDLRYCKGCGLCAHLCPKHAIIMIPEQD